MHERLDVQERLGLRSPAEQLGRLAVEASSVWQAGQFTQLQDPGRQQGAIYDRLCPPAPGLERFRTRAARPERRWRDEDPLHHTSPDRVVFPGEGLPMAP